MISRCASHQNNILNCQNLCEHHYCWIRLHMWMQISSLTMRSFIKTGLVYTVKSLIDTGTGYLFEQISIVTDWVTLPNKVSKAAGFLPFVEDRDPGMICADLCIRLWTLVNLNTHMIKVFEQLFIVNNTQMYLKLNSTLKTDISAPQELSVFTKAQL